MSSLVFPAVEAPMVPTPAGLISPASAAGGVFSPFAGVADDTSSESSSIGSPSSDEEDDDDRGSDGAQSKSTADDSTGSGSSSLGSLSSLEDSLPTKKGLSSHFAGKSRSFSNLSECAGGNAGDLAKSENPFNKRRRIQISAKISYKRRASCSSLLLTTLLPPLLSPEHALHEGTEEEDGNDDDDSDDDDDDVVMRRRKGLLLPSLAPTPHGANFYREKASALKSARSVPLFDLRYA